MATDVQEGLGSGWHGLAPEEAGIRSSAVGRNVLPRAKGSSPVHELLFRLTQLFAAMLWIAAALAFVGRMPQLGDAGQGLLRGP